MSLIAPCHVTVLGNFVPAPWAAQLLRMLGATVTKIEPPAGDALRESQLGLYEYLNQGFEVLALDLREADGLRRARRAVDRSDVIIESFRPGKLAKFGLDAKSVLTTHPSIVYCSISGFGQTGPLSRKVGHDLTYLAWSGVYELPINASGDQARPSVPLADASVSLFSVISILAWLRERERTRRGGWIDAPLAETSLAIAALRAGWLIRESDGARKFPHITAASDTYALADGGRVAVSLHEDHFWSEFVRVLGGRFPALREPRFARLSQRQEHNVELAQQLTAAFRSLGATDLIELLENPDLPVTLVQSIDEAIDSEHGRSRALVGLNADAKHVGFPVVFNGRRPTPVGWLRLSGTEGEHGD